MSRGTVVVALIAAVLAVDNILLVKTVRDTRNLEQAVAALQIKVGRYVASADPTVSSSQYRRTQNRLLHELVLARFLARAILLRDQGALALSPRQVEQAKAAFQPVVASCEALNQLDHDIAIQLRPLELVFSEPQHAWIREHGDEVHQKVIEIVAASKRDDSVAHSFARFWDTPGPASPPPVAPADRS